MPFCSQCGKDIVEDARFCPACGSAIGARPVAAPTPASVPAPAATSASRPAPAAHAASSASASKGAKTVAGVLNILLIVLSFFPWIKVDLYIWSDEYSIPGLLELSNNLQSWASSLGGSSYTSSEVAGTISGITLLVAIVWLVVVVLLGRDTYRCLSGKRGFPTAGAAAMCALSMLSLFVIISIDQLIASNAGTSLGVTSATLWVWVSIGLSIVLLVYAGAKEEKFNEKAEQ